MSRSFGVVTDSTSDVPPEWQERYGIEVVPLSVQFGSQTFRDGVDLTPKGFYEMLAGSDRLPTTAAPPPGAFAEVYERLSHTCDGVISIHIASRLSATGEAARIGAQSVEGFRVHVIDSGSLTMCAAFLCRVAAESERLEDALDRVELRIPRQRILALLDTLRYVMMGGRVGRAQGFIGNVLDLKPILRMQDGEITPVDRVRTRSRALPRLVELLVMDRPLEHLAVMHAQAPDDCERVRQELASALPGLEIETGEIGSVLGTHVGPGAVGMAYIKA